MKTIAQHWSGFETAVMSETTPAVQRQVMKRAFYAGFFAALMAGREMADESGDDDDLGVQMMQSLNDECERFALAVGAGKE